MQDNDDNRNEDLHNHEIDLRELFHVLLKGKWLIVSVTSFVSILAVLYSLSLPNIYQSQALLVPVKPSQSFSGALENYSGLATLAGVSLPTQSTDNNAVKAIEKLNSLSFFEENFMPNIFLPNLMAIESWDSKNNVLNFKKEIYDLTSKTWVRDFFYPQKLIPSSQESFKIFKAKHLSISEDKKTGFIIIAIKHQSPYVAKRWTELLINEINTFYRLEDKAKAEKAVMYLNAQISKTSFAEIKQVIAGLLQQETQKLTLIEANDSYVFDYIDPPAVMERKIEPKRSLICVFGALLGGILGLLIVLIQHYIFRKKFT
tara:strand:+ start:324 stop:1271 length:948 start_codon:yes stop_codon:yes gene_type:complete